MDGILGATAMAEIDKDLQRWYALQAELATVKEQEMTLRKKIFAHFFPTPNEGTNTVPLGANWKIVAKYPITRTVDKGLLTTMTPVLREAGINVDDVIRWKPELAVTVYRNLTADQIHLVDQCLEIKPGSPSLDLVAPKEKK